MKRRSPVVVLIILFCSMFIARNWWTPLLADGFFALALPLGLLASIATLVVAVLAVHAMPRTDRSGHRLNTIYLLLSMVVGTLIFDLAYGRGLPAGSFASDFDSKRWRESDSAEYSKGDITDRQKMLGSVVRQIVPEAERATLESLLGIAEPTGYFAELRPDLLYCLGPERGFIGIDSEWLAIWFDDNSIAERWELLTD